MILLPTFYSEKFGLEIAFIGIVIFLARLIDIITDPIMGWISDKNIISRKFWVIFGGLLAIFALNKLFVIDSIPYKNYLLICPNISVSTKEMFTRLNIDELKMDQQNSFLDILLREHKSIEDFYFKFENEYKLKLSGTGSTLFLEYDNKDKIEKILKKIPKNWRFFLCEGLQYSPLIEV